MCLLLTFYTLIDHLQVTPQIFRTWLYIFRYERGHCHRTWPPSGTALIQISARVRLTAELPVLSRDAAALAHAPISRMRDEQHLVTAALRLKDVVLAVFQDIWRKWEHCE